MTTAAGAKRTRSKDLGGIRLRGRSYQVRVFSGNDPNTGEKVYLTGSAMNEAEAIRIRDRFRTDIANNRATKSSGTLGFLLTTWLDQHPADPELVADYRFLADSNIIPALGNVRLTTLTMPGPSRIEKFYAELRRYRRRCDKKPYIEHRKNCPSATDPDYACDKRCKEHACKPLSGSTLRHIHVVLNGAFKAAVKWDWIGVNPLDAVDKPKAPTPQPNPPSTVNAARIIEKAWATDADVHSRHGHRPAAHPT